MDLTTIGVKLGYAVAATNGTKPTAFTWLERCKSIGGISLSQETIDVTALEDYIMKYAEGRADTGGSWELVFGVNDKVVTALETMLAAAKTAKESNKEIWWDVWFPGLQKSFYVVATPGTKIALPEIGGGSPAEFPVSLTVNEYIGLDTAVEPKAATTTGE